MKSLKKQKIHLDIKKAKNKKGCSIAVALFARKEKLYGYDGTCQKSGTKFSGT